jgi:Flp pilus assembly pilin Flp
MIKYVKSKIKNFVNDEKGALNTLEIIIIAGVIILIGTVMYVWFSGNLPGILDTIKNKLMSSVGL